MLKASFVINSRFFSTNDFSITCNDPNVQLKLSFDDSEGWVLTKNDSLIYERGKTRFEPQYKGKKLSIKTPTFKGFPIEFAFPEEGRICVFKPQGIDFNTSEYSILNSDKERIGELVVKTPFLSSTKTYAVNIADIKNTDTMLFVLMYMVCKLNDASGT